VFNIVIVVATIHCYCYY